MTAAPRLRALLVEDEPLALARLRALVDKVEWIERIGEATNGLDAVTLVDRLEPALVFLDLWLPELSGLDVLQRVRHQPLVVFTTAYDREAVTAFELGALDYLVKPFGEERFMVAVNRVRARWTSEPGPPDGRARYLEATAGRSPLDRIFTRRAGEIVPIALDRVTRFEGSDDYVAVHVEGRVHHVALRLGDLERRLDPARFRRIHRSHIVQIAHIASMRPLDNGRLVVRLRDGSTVVASRAGSRGLRKLVV